MFYIQNTFAFCLCVFVLLQLFRDVACDFAYSPLANTPPQKKWLCSQSSHEGNNLYTRVSPLILQVKFDYISISTLQSIHRKFFPVTVRQVSHLHLFLTITCNHYFLNFLITTGDNLFMTFLLYCKLNI
jgi:hypothetical protein